MPQISFKESDRQILAINDRELRKHKRAGEYDAAIAAKHEVVRSGCRSVPQRVPSARAGNGCRPGRVSAVWQQR